MKRHLFLILFLTFIILFSIILTSINEVVAFNNDNIIYIDAGHGGFDGGANSKDNLIIEKDITLQASLFLKNYLEKTGYKVYLTREKDCALGNTKKKDIYKRVDLINKSNCLLYISIHANSYPASSVKGAQVFYSSNNITNKILSNKIMMYIKTLDATNKRIEKEIKGKYLLDYVNKTGCLVELGFLTNQDDLYKLTNEDTLKELSFMIYLGILEYLEEQTHE